MAGKTPYTQEQFQLLVDMYHDGKTFEDIAAVLNCTTSTVQRHVNRLGFTRPKLTHTREFTQEQIQFIKANHETMTIHAMADELGLNWTTVQNKMRDLGLPCVIEDKTWSEKDVTKLRNLAAQGKSVEEIAELMNRTDNAIYIAARRRGIKIYQSNRKWSLEELDYLKRSWGKISVESIAKHVHRDVSAVCQQAHKMRIGPLYNNSENISLADFCRATGISRDRVMGTLAPKHDFPLLSKKYGKQKYYYFVDYNNILKWMKKHQRLYDASMIQDGFFVPEPEWLKNKRRRDRFDKSDITQDAIRRPWTSQEISHAKLLRRQGYSVKQIADKIGRNIPAVRSKLYNSGASFTLPRYWTGKEFKFLQDNWQAMSDAELAEAMGRPVSSIESHRHGLGLYRRKPYGKKDPPPD